MTYWLRVVVQFVVLTFQSEQSFYKWKSKCKFSCLEQVSGLILRVHTEILYLKTLQTLLGACEQTKRSKKLFISVPSRIDLERHGR